MQEKITRWSIRRLGVGVASVVVASGFFMITSPANSVLAKEGNVTPVTQTTPNKVDKEKESKSDEVNKLIKNAVDTALTNSNDSSTSPKSTESTTNKTVENKVEDRAATPAETTPITSSQQVKDSVANNIKSNTEVPASYLEKANVPGPFLAGVNQVIPYEAFGGDGMLTRLLLKSSENAPWSDNGTAKNPALLPLEGLTKGQYFYEVDLNGNTVGKDGQDLLEQLRANGTHTYLATIKVYGAKDGKPDLSNLVATRQVTIQLRGKEMATIPSQQGQMNTKSSETGSTGTTEGMMGTNHHMSDMKVDQPASSPMANMMKKDDKPMLPNTGEAQTTTAGLGALGLVLAGLVGFLGWKTKRED